MNVQRKETTKNQEFVLRRNQANVSSSTVYKAWEFYFTEKELLRKSGV